MEPHLDDTRNDYDATAKFDAGAVLIDVRAHRAASKHRSNWGKSRLVKHRAELVQMRQQGASLGDLVVWLRREKRLKVERSTVKRYLDKLPEVAA